MYFLFIYSLFTRFIKPRALPGFHCLHWRHFRNQWSNDDNVCFVFFFLSHYLLVGEGNNIVTSNTARALKYLPVLLLLLLLHTLQGKISRFKQRQYKLKNCCRSINRPNSPCFLLLLTTRLSHCGGTASSASHLHTHTHTDVHITRCRSCVLTPELFGWMLRTRTEGWQPGGGSEHGCSWLGARTRYVTSKTLSSIGDDRGVSPAGGQGYI